MRRWEGSEPLRAWSFRRKWLWPVGNLILIFLSSSSDSEEAEMSCGRSRELFLVCKTSVAGVTTNSVLYLLPRQGKEKGTLFIIPLFLLPYKIGFSMSPGKFKSSPLSACINSKHCLHSAGRQKSLNLEMQGRCKIQASWVSPSHKMLWQCGVAQ